MVLDRPVDTVIEEFHYSYMRDSRQIRIKEYLEDNGESVTAHYSFESDIEWGRLYLITVPSLNLEATNHQILVDTRYDAIEVYDPQKGRPGKKFYTYGTDDSANELAVKLKAFVIDFSIA